MAGHRNFNELRGRMASERRAANQQATRETLHAMLLSELRRAAGTTQTELAETLGIRQPTLSQLESQDDMQISTLRRIVKALGGELEIIATFPNERVALRQFEQE